MSLMDSIQCCLGISNLQGVFGDIVEQNGTYINLSRDGSGHTASCTSQVKDTSGGSKGRRPPPYGPKFS